MKKKIITLSVLITSFSLIILFVMGCIFNKNTIYSEAESNIVSITTIFANNYDDDNKILKIDDDNVRETIIDKEGVVIADSIESDVSKMENHLDREEIVAALSGTPKVVIRESATLGKTMMYYALKIDTNDTYIFIRTSLTISNIDSYVYQYLPWMIIVLVVVIGASIFLVILLSKNITKPLEELKNNLDDINNGKYCANITSTGDDKINNILLDVNNISNKLNDNVIELKKEREKLSYILDSISDSVVVLDKNLDIILMNQNANLLFNVTNIIGKNYIFLTSDKEFLNSVYNVSNQKENKVFEYCVKNKTYLVNYTRTKDGILLLVLTNITTEKDNQTIRSEFFSNASHELKTPLTSIIGFNELVKIKNTNPNISKYVDQIEVESKRMLTLIDDMLSLSKLENKKKIGKEDVILKDVVKEVFDSLAPVAKEHNVSLSMEGEFNFVGEKDDFYKLIKNLVENGIKYNTKDGYVKVLLNNKERTIIVTDNGIGIKSEDQERVFERFYRVDKSRSKESGGTGLGLAIVKHIVNLYGAKISLKSRIGEGTTITIQF
ncbi:MAG: ATP-binding protein [Bacilli bacterium]